MSSAEFYRRFHAGELGDDADMFEWSAFYQKECGLLHEYGETA